MKNFQNVDGAKVSVSSHFQNDLGLDSLDTVEVKSLLVYVEPIVVFFLNFLCVLQMVMAFEDEFAVEIPDAEADKILTVSAAIDYIAGHPQAK